MLRYMDGDVGGDGVEMSGVDWSKWSSLCILREVALLNIFLVWFLF